MVKAVQDVTLQVQKGVVSCTINVDIAAPTPYLT